MTKKKIVALPRRADWEVALLDALRIHQQTPFAYGTSDCLTLVADASKAVTGLDPMDGVRGTYSTARGATAALKKAGFKSIEAALAGTFEPIEIGLARRGDIGLVETGSGLAAVVVMGPMLMGKAAPAAGAGAADIGQHFIGREKLIQAFRNGA